MELQYIYRLNIYGSYWWQENAKCFIVYGRNDEL